MKCKICQHNSKKIFTKKILNKYECKYFRCSKCGFIQTEKPYWLDESYNNVITSMDIGLIGRNLLYSDKVEQIIYNHFNKNGIFLDYAGGYGMFTRIMRDKGFDFYHQDDFCENLFSNNFTISDLPKKTKFELITSFEMMEHVENPIKKLEHIFSLTDNFLFTTELAPKSDIKNWWYIGEEHGQHISFYTQKSLRFLAKKFHKNYFVTNNSLHLFTDKDNFDFEVKMSVFEKICNKYRLSHRKDKLDTKTQSDYEMIKMIANNK